MTGELQFLTPPWLAELITPTRNYSDPSEIMALAIRIAGASVVNGGGPFGAVVADSAGTIVEAGWNCVVQSRDSSAHAEVICMRRAQRKLGTHDLSQAAGAPLALYTSTEPCVQCFGAIYWSGLKQVYAAATTADAEKLGFDEGPVGADLWQQAGQRKGIVLTSGVCRDQAALEPFLKYREANGPIY